MSQQILFVDDDNKILNSFRRSLPSWFKVVTANSPEEGLRILEEQGPFPVIVSDMRMPGMNGVELLRRSKIISPNTARILLTGYADQQTAIDAVNKGDLFRFLTKPCDIETLSSVLRAGVRQYQLLISEKELLEQTLLGTIKVLSQFLALVNPEAQGVACRLKRYCEYIAKNIQLEEDVWVYEMAATLSQLGCATIPAEVLAKHYSGKSLDVEEESMVAQHPAVAVKMLMHIPRLERVTEIVALQNKPYSYFPEVSDLKNYSKVHLGAQILHVAVGFHQLLTAGVVPAEAISLMVKAADQYNPFLVATLSHMDLGQENMVLMKIQCNELNKRMILDEDIYSTKGMLLASKGQRVTEPIRMGMINYSKSIGIKEPFSVLIPILDAG